MKRARLTRTKLALAAAAVFVVAVIWLETGFSQAVVVPGQQVPITWRRIESNGAAVSAAKVPGGWFVAVFSPGTNVANIGTADGVFFYPDPLHEWNGVGVP
jgi:hypothetical protein